MKKQKVQKVTTLIPSTESVKIVIGGIEIKTKSLIYLEHELCLN